MKGLGADRKLKAAVFGTGWWSKFQIPAWLHTGGVELAGLYNRTAGKARAVAPLYGNPPVYDDAEELLLREPVDFVDIITEAPAHRELVLLAAKYKKPVVCQKPMAQSWQDCLDMVKACEEAGVPFYINENYRFQPPVRLVKKLLDEGVVGRPYRANIRVSTGGPGFLANQPFLASLRHYALFDCGPHVFDMARFLFGNPDDVYCKCVRSVDSIKGDDAFSAILGYKELVCTCEVVDYYDSKIFIDGTNGAIEFRPDYTFRVITKQGVKEYDCKQWTRQPWISSEDEALLGPDCAQAIYDTQEGILKSLQTGKPCESMASDNLKTMAIVFSAIESSLTKRVITMQGF
jgi:D-apiose dehydrogenase